MKHNIFSDLRKPGLVPGESLSLSKKYEFCFRETLIYNISLCSSAFKVYSENITYISKYICMYNCLITSYVNV